MPEFNATSRIHFVHPAFQTVSGLTVFMRGTVYETLAHSNGKVMNALNRLKVYRETAVFGPVVRPFMPSREVLCLIRLH